MKVKVCYKDEIHRISNLPEAFDELMKVIPTIFHAQLPESWTLQYKDSDGDNILITDEKDYEEFKNTEPTSATAIAKIFVISAESFRAPQVVLEETKVIEPEKTEIKREDEYQVIESEENKPDEVIQIKEEIPEVIPVQEEQEKPEPEEIQENEEIIKKVEVQEEPKEDEEQPEEQVEEKVEKQEEEEEKPQAESEHSEKKEEENEGNDISLSEKDILEENEEKEEKEEKIEKEEPELPEVQEEPKIEEQEIKEDVPEVKEEEVQEKPVEKLEEQKIDLAESMYSKIIAPREEKMFESYELIGSKICIDVKDLNMLVSSMIEKKLPEIAQFTQNQIEEQRSQLSQSMVMDQSLLVSEELPPKPSAPKVIHYDTKCMGCGMTPIQGIRYKCTTCPNFDYCEQCEEAGTHPHNFIKMRQRGVQDIFKPVQPLKPFAVPVKPVSQPVDWNKKNEMKESEKKKPVQDAQHYDKIVDKAKKLQKCFPKEDFDMLCVYINDAPEDMTIEELVENYKLGMNKE